jgi:S-adenosylmethionine decarboxylase
VISPPPTLGHHAMLELFGCDPAACDDPHAVRRALHDAAAAMGTPVLGEAYHRFAPQGVSGVILIAESHVSCHSWPEVGYVAVDIYTCGAVPPKAALDAMRRAFGARTWLVQDVVRGLVEFAPETSSSRAHALLDLRAFHRPMPRTAAGPQPGFRSHVLAAQGVVNVTGLVDDATSAAVREEAAAMLAQGRASSPRLEELHRQPALREVLAQVAGRALGEAALALPCTEGRQGQPWRWAPGGYALWWVLQAAGSLLQCVPHQARGQGEREALVGQPITTYELAPGQLYLLRAETTMHRTLSLGEDTRLVVLEVSWT